MKRNEKHDELYENQELELFEYQLTPEGLKLTWSDRTQAIFHPIWLRENSNHPDNRDPGTKLRLVTAIGVNTIIMNCVSVFKIPGPMTWVVTVVTGITVSWNSIDTITESCATTTTPCLPCSILLLNSVLLLFTEYR